MLTVHTIKIYSCNKFEVFKTKKKQLNINICKINQLVKENELNFNTLFILCTNLYSVYEECIKIINIQQANEHMPIKNTGEKLLKAKAVIWFNKTCSLNHPTSNA